MTPERRELGERDYLELRIPDACGQPLMVRFVQQELRIEKIIKKGTIPNKLTVLRAMRKKLVNVYLNLNASEYLLLAKIALQVLNNLGAGVMRDARNRPCLSLFQFC